MEIRALSELDAVPGGVAAIVELYEAASPMGDRNGREFREHLLVHEQRAGFRLIAAVEQRMLAGFAYGYLGEQGQWWPTWVAEHAPADTARKWLGGHFEVVEVAVYPSMQRHGIGRRLFTALLDGVPHERRLLTTQRTDHAARMLYESLGWRTLVEDLDGTYCLYGQAVVAGPDSRAE